MGKQTVLYSWESRRYYINGKADGILFMGKQTVFYSWESRDGILFMGIIMGKQTVLYSWESRRY